MSNPMVSIIIPAYNEATIIKDTLQQLATFLHRHQRFIGSYELIVVASGNDATAEIARAHSNHFERLIVVEPRINHGKGADVKAGFTAAHGDLQLFFDADLSTPLTYLLTMVSELRQGADVAIGARDLSTIHAGRMRSFVSRITHVVTAPLLPGIKDTQCGAKGFKKEAARLLFGQQRQNGWDFDIELLMHAREAGLKIVQVPITDWHEAREEHLSGDSVTKAAAKAGVGLLTLYTRALLTKIERHAWPVALIGALGTAALAVWIGADHSMWFDEAYSVMLMKQPWLQLIHFTSVDVHPPIYYMLLKLWAQIWGQSDIALRSLSIVAGSLAAGIGLLLVKRMFSAKAMLLTLPCVVLAPFLLRYDVEARMYAVASLICIAATYVLVVAMQRKRAWLWVAYAALVLIGVYTLYYTALIWLVHFVWCSMYPKTGRRTFKSFVWQPWIAAYGGALLLFLPWVVYVLPYLHSSAWFGPPRSQEIINVFSMALGYKAEWQVDSFGIAAGLLLVALVITAVVRAYRSLTPVKRHYLILVILYLCLPIALLFAASIPPLKPLFLYRYFAHTIVALYLLLGIITACSWRFKATKVMYGLLLCVLVFGVMTLHTVSNYNFDSLREPHAKEVAAYLEAHQTASDMFVAGRPELYVELVRYMDPSQLYFYSSYPIPSAGGYAMIYGNPHQIHDPSLLHKTLLYVDFSEKPSMPFPSGSHAATVFQADKYRVLEVSPN